MLLAPGVHNINAIAEGYQQQHSQVRNSDRGVSCKFLFLKVRFYFETLVRKLVRYKEIKSVIMRSCYLSAL